MAKQFVLARHHQGIYFGFITNFARLLMFFQRLETLRSEERQLVKEIVPYITLALNELLFGLLQLLLLLSFDLSSGLVLHLPLFYIFVEIG